MNAQDANCELYNSKIIISVFVFLFILPSASTMKTLPGAIYVVDELDYESKQSYDLVIRATDSLSGEHEDVFRLGDKNSIN